MSQFPPALNFVLDHEDRNRAYAVVPDPGGAAIAGINSRAWPTAYANIARLPQVQRASAVANFYQTEFWNVMRLGGLQSQDLANRVLDCGVNCGLYTATRMLQSALNTAYGWKIAVDGILGPDSLTAINDADAERLLAAYRQARVEHYENIVKLNPADEVYLPAWKERAQA